MAEEQDCELPEDQNTSEISESEHLFLDGILRDPRKKEWALKMMGLADDSRTPSGKNGNGNTHPTLSGTDTGGRGETGLQPSWPPMSMAPFWWPPRGTWPPAPASTSSAGNSEPSTSSQDPSVNRGKKRTRSQPEDDGEDDSDSVVLLDDTEALELVEFDPSVDPEGSWKPPKALSAFLEKHFNRSLTEEERQAIMKDFPKPGCTVLSVPRLDEQVKQHLKRKGKDPHFGAEKTLYKLQEQLLDVTGPLTCFWADLLNKEASISQESILLLIQRSLVLLGSASHLISQERRKIAWNRINPKLKALADEDYEKRETNLFGPGFLEKASKRLEVDKTMQKVAQPQATQSSIGRKYGRYANDKADLRHFLARVPPAQYGSRRNQNQGSKQPYDPRKSRKYFPFQNQKRQGPDKPDKPKQN